LSDREVMQVFYGIRVDGNRFNVVHFSVILTEGCVHGSPSYSSVLKPMPISERRSGGWRRFFVGSSP
jgi:hypothetical protein